MTRWFAPALRAVLLGVVILIGPAIIRGTSPEPVTWRELVTAAWAMIMLVMMIKIMGFVVRKAFPSQGGSVHTASAPAGSAALRKAGSLLPLSVAAGVARHEAAHAVAIMVLGHDVLKITTEPGPGYLGRCSWKAPDKEPAAVGSVAISLIGHLVDAAENMTPDKPGDDYEMALKQSLHASALTGRAPSEILDEGMALAQKIYAENQDPIDRLAAKLMLQPITLDNPVEIRSIAWPDGTGPAKNQENPHG